MVPTRSTDPVRRQAWRRAARIARLHQDGRVRRLTPRTRFRQRRGRSQQWGHRKQVLACESTLVNDALYDSSYSDQL
jgi:hypothetical protein